MTPSVYSFCFPRGAVGLEFVETTASELWLMKLPPGLSFCIVALSLALAGCETVDNPPAAKEPPQPAFAGYNSPYPGQSGVGISPALEQDAIRSLRFYLKKEHGSEAFEIVDRQTLGAAPDFMIDNLGRLVAGSLHEVWTIRRDGKVEKLEFIMFSDGKRGNTVGFKTYKE